MIPLSRGLKRSFIYCIFLLLFSNNSFAAIITVNSGASSGLCSVSSSDTLLIYGTVNCSGTFSNNGVIINNGNFNVGNFNNVGIFLNNNLATISQTFTNGSLGVISNKDTLSIGGDFIDNNAGKYGVLGGTVKFYNSTSNQKVSNAGSGIILFNNLIVSGYSKDIDGTVVVENKLDLQAIINIPSSTDTLALDSSAFTINYSPSSFVKGSLFRRARHGIGTDPSPMIFPIGDANGNYRPVVLTNLPLASLNKWVLQVSSVGSVFGGGSINPPQSLMTKRYWQMHLLSNSAGFNISSANVTLYYTSSDLNTSVSPTSIVVAEHVGSSPGGTYGSLGSQGYTAGTYSSVTSSSKAILSNGIDSYLALATTLCSSATGTLDVTPNDTICQGTSVTFSISNPSTTFDSVVYYKNSIRVKRGPQGTTYVLSNSIDGDNISAILWKSNCSSATNSITLSVTSPFVVKLGNDTIVCTGYSTTLSTGISSATNYLWSNGASSSTLPITVNSNISYWAKVSKGGCTSSDTIKYTVIQNVASAPAVSVSNITSNSLKFYWSAITNASAYEISLNNGATWTAANGTGGLSHTFTGLSSNTTYAAIVRAKNSCNSKTSQALSAKTLAGCTITYTSSGDTAVCQVPASIVLQLSNINIGTYKISYEGGAFSRNTSYSVTVSPTTASPYKLYFQIIDSTNSSGCNRSDSIVIYRSTVDASWSNLATSYCITSPPVKLIPTNPGGEFAGPGVSFVDSLNGWYFYPSFATPGSISISYTICGTSVSKSTTLLNSPCTSSIIAGSTTGTTLIKSPEGISTDCDGSIYFTDSENNAIWKVDPYGTPSVVVGDTTGSGTTASGAGDGVGVVTTPAAVKLKQPTGLVVVGGDIYFCDSKNNKIKKYDRTTNTVVLIAGDGTYGDVVGAGATSQFRTPIGIAMDPSLNYLYIADQLNYKVKRIALNAGNLVTVAAGDGVQAYTDGPAANAEFDAIQHLAVDATGLYIADPNNNCIRKLTFATNTVSTVVGPTAPGYLDGAPGKYKINQPNGVAVDCSGNIYFADFLNCAIRVANSSGTVTTIAGSYPTKNCGNPVDGTGTQAVFDNPAAISVFVKGYIDVADFGSNSIRRIAIQNWRQGAWTGLNMVHCANDPADTLKPVTCTGYYTGPGISQVAGKWLFTPPSAGSYDLVYHFQNGFCGDTLMTRVLINPLPQPDLGPSTEYICQADYAGYILDAGLNGAKPYASYQWYKGHSSTSLSLITGATSRYLKLPTPAPAPGDSIIISVAVKDSNTCIGTDVIKIIIKSSSSIKISGADSICYGGSTSLTVTPSLPLVWNSGSTSNPLLVTATGDYAVSATAPNGCISKDTFRVVQKYAPPICMSVTNTSGTSLGYGSYTNSIFAGPGATGKGATISLGIIQDLYLGKLGQNIYIVEGGNLNDIGRIRVADTTLSNFAGNTTSGTYIDSAALGASHFKSPYGLVELSNGTFFLADSNQQIVKIDTIAGIVTTYAGKPVLSGTKDGLDTLARFNSPSDITTDAIGNIYVADRNNHKIRKISPQGLVTTIAGDSSAVPASGLTNGKSYSSRFNSPVGIEIDVQGNLLVTDGGVIRKITMDTLVSTFASGFSSLSNIATDKYGNIYVADYTAGTVTKISKTGIVSNPPLISGLIKPTGISIDPVTERIYVADNSSGKGRITTSIKNKSVTICAGDSVKINASCSNAKNYSWSPSTGLSSTTVANPIAHPTVTTTYILTITDFAGCTNTDSVIVLVNPKPIAKAGTDTTMCAGGSKILGASSVTSYSYKWLPTTGMQTGKDTTANPLITFPSTNGSTVINYIVSVQDKVTGCKNKDTAVVTIKALPTKTLTQTLTICKNDSVQLTTSTSATTYSWGPNYNITSTSVASPKVFPYVDTTYILTASLVYTNGPTCINKDSIKIKVNPLPVANAGTDTTLCAGGSKTMGISSGINYTTYSYKWNPTTGMQASKDTTATPLVTYPNNYLSASIKYILIVKNRSTGCKDTNSALIIIKALPTHSAIQNVNVCKGDSVVIGPNNVSASSYLWNISYGLNSATVRNPKASPAKDTTYILTLGTTYPNSGPTCTTKDSVNVKVNPTPTPSFTTNKGCATDTVRFIANSTLTPSSYKWYFGDGTSSISANVLHTFSAAGNYNVKLIATASNGCKDSVTVPISVNKKPTPNFTYLVGCSGVTFTDASISNDTTTVTNWNWNFGDNTTSLIKNPPIHTYPTVGTYNIKLIVGTSEGCSDTLTKSVIIQNLSLNAGNDTTICQGSFASLNGMATGGTSPYTYSWIGSSLSANNVSNPKATPTSLGQNKYVLSVTDASGCTLKDSLNVTVAGLPTVDAGPANVSICTGKTFTLGSSPTASSAAGIKYIIWSPNASLSGNAIPNPITSTVTTIKYFVSATDNNGCVNKDSIVITVNPLPDPTITADKPSGCVGTNLNLSVNPSGIGPFTINWTNLTTISSAGTGSSIPVTTSATYKVVVIDNSTTCSDSSTKSVNFINPPTAVSIKAADSNCVNVPDSLVAIASGDNLNYVWSTSNGVGNFSDSLTANTIYTPNSSDPSSLSVSLRAYNVCDTIIVTKNIRMDPIPAGSFVFTPLQNFEKDTVLFMNNSDTVLYSIKKWTWDFKDGTSSVVFNPTHAFSNPGTYNVNLSLINKFGCVFNYSVPIEIFDYHICYVPNAFAPLGLTPENKVCKVYGTKISPNNFSFRIYSRWGDLIYETSNFAQANTVGWDGNNTEKEPQSMGVYTWVVKGEFIDGTPIEKTGTVTLIR